MIGIYKITNKVNQKIYIGQSTNIQARWTKHKNSPFNSLQPQYDTYFYKAIRKYGLDNFSFEVIEECSIDSLNEREIYWIAYYNSNNADYGYNSTEGGTYGRYQKLSKEEVQEIKTLLRETKLSQQEIAGKFNVSQCAISYINIGKNWIDETIVYPIRKESIKKKEDFLCPNCGKKVFEKGNFCKPCADIKQRIVERPTREHLKEQIRNESFESIGRFYGVSGKTIVHWCKSFNLPEKKKEIKLYSDLDWDNI